MDSLGAKSQHQTPEKTNLKVVETLYYILHARITSQVTLKMKTVAIYPPNRYGTNIIIVEILVTWPCPCIIYAW